MEGDDGTRTTFAVVVTLVDRGDGTSMLVLDDAKTDNPRRETTWKFDSFYTHKRMDSQKLNDMALPNDEYEGLGAAIVARLLALNGRT
jgi:hypothetical protein